MLAACLILFRSVRQTMLIIIFMFYVELQFDITKRFKP
jgi:hypothetical protein